MPRATKAAPPKAAETPPDESITAPAPEAQAEPDAAPETAPAPEAATAQPEPEAAAPAAAAPITGVVAPAAASTGSALLGPIGSKLSDTKEIATVLYYGDPGSTKTTSALSLANLGRTLMINVEAGAKRTPLKQRGINLDNAIIWPPEPLGPGHITFETVEAEVFEPMRAQLEADPSSWVGVSIDSFSELSKRLLDDVTQKAAAKAANTGKARERFQVDLADHGTTSQMMRTLLRRFRDLGVHVAITALERRDMDGDTGQVKYGPNMGPAIALDTMGLMDIVMYCTIEEIGPDGDTETFAIGTSRPVARRQAKDRFGILPVRMVDPTMERIIGYLHGDITKENDPRQLAAREAVQRARDAAGVPAA